MVLPKLLWEESSLREYFPRGHSFRDRFLPTREKLRTDSDYYNQIMLNHRSPVNQKLTLTPGANVDESPTPLCLFPPLDEWILQTGTGSTDSKGLWREI